MLSLPRMGKVILHIDLNAFFATAESLRHPEWGDEPIIVGGESFRGVVSTCSYSARAFGVKSAMPIVEAKRLCPKGHFLPCDFPYYAMLSRSFFAYLFKWSQLIEPLSIDEGYIDISKGIKNAADPLAYLHEIQEGLYREIGLKSSLGVAPTKFLAKMGSDMKKPMGITIIRKKDIAKILYPLPVSSFYGIGNKSAAALTKEGILTIGDLAKMIFADEQWGKRRFGKFSEEIRKDLLGQSDDTVDVAPADPKSVGHSETFPYDTDDETMIKDKIRELAHRSVIALRNDHKRAKTVVLTVKDSAFHSFTRSLTLPEASEDEATIVKTALGLYENNFLGKELRLVGVSLSSLVDPRKETLQMSLWNYQEYEKLDRTKLLVHELNRQLKKPSLTIASQKKGSKKDGHRDR